MPASRLRSLVPILAIGLVAITLATASPVNAQTAAPAAAATGGPTPRDGQHDFDWMAGTWKASLKRLVNPLTGSKTWVELSGTQRTWHSLGGRACMDEFVVENPTDKTKIEALTVRLYNPANQTWSIYWANAKNGAFSMPATVGKWENGRGEFYDYEEWNGRWILVRFTWSDVTPTSAHFEQAFSTDAGKTWEVNWISDLYRDKAGS
jgi:hypothetical protein